ncbi:MAG: hypothetical protein REH83_06080 [Rickettsiella sp.]|nr:hypothetical protein [Rickettsiella sp.]
MLQTDLSNFMQAPTRLSSHRLISRIDALINDIKPQLLEPSNTEDDKLQLLIANLGRIIRNLKDIKTVIKIN